jgi:glucose/arabinose dehydrogenase
MTKAVLLIFSILIASVHGSCSGGSGSDKPGAPPPSFPSIRLEAMTGGFTQPTHITHAGDGSGRVFVVERAGIIRVIRNNAMLPEPFLDITDKVIASGSEQGLLSAAFPPGYADKGYFYVNYTARPDGNTAVSRYRLTDDADRADPLSEEMILTVAQPFANHNGGQIAFGPDGFLYIGMGDGGSGGDPRNNAQNPASLLGKILRIDTESAQSGGYAVPASNPFFGNNGYRAEIWALGLRNPWRFSFDRTSGDLYIADVGQNAREEVNFQNRSGTGGENYGWNIMEGSLCFRESGCSSEGLVLPVAEYDQSLGDCSVTGGFVYRGSEFSQIQGLYFYGDYCSGRIRAMRRSGTSFISDVLLDTSLRISTFGEDEAGNLYVVDYSGGGIHKLAAAD